MAHAGGASSRIKANAEMRRPLLLVRPAGLPEEIRWTRVLSKPGRGCCRSVLILNLVLEELGKIERFVFGYQPFDIQIDEVVGRFLVETEFFKIKDAVGRMAFIAGDADLFSFDVAVKKIEPLFFLLRRQAFFGPHKSQRFGGIARVNQ